MVVKTCELVLGVYLEKEVEIKYFKYERDGNFIIREIKSDSAIEQLKSDMELIADFAINHFKDKYWDTVLNRIGNSLGKITKARINLGGNTFTFRNIPMSCQGTRKTPIKISLVGEDGKEYFTKEAKTIAKARRFDIVFVPSTIGV